MTSELRKSAGSDIKRLQEMVKRLEEQNAQLKTSDYSLSRRTPNNRVMGDENMVKVKLNLDDVPLLDLNAMVEEDEDTWLYVSPKHPPSAEQRKISPYKYLKDSLDVPELNKVRGSLLAKLESIAAQEEALSRSPPSEGHHHHHHHHHSEHSRADDSLHKGSVQLSDEDDDNDHQVTPRRRVPSFTTPSQDDSDLVVKGPLRRRGGPSKPVTSLHQSPGQVNDEDSDSNDDNNTHRPVQRRVPAVPTFQPSDQEDASLVVRGPLKRRGPSPQSRASFDAVSYEDGNNVDNGFVPQERPQRRVPASQEYEDLVVKGPLRRRGGTPQPRQPVAPGPVKRRGESPQPRGSSDAVSYVDSNDVDNGFVPQQKPQRRVPASQEYEDLVVKGPLKRRGGTPRPRQPVASAYGLLDNEEEEYKDVQPRRRGPSPAGSSQDDYNSSWQRDEVRSDPDVPVVTAVRRREPNQVKRREPARPRTAEDTEVRRRSLPQAPTYSRGVASSRQSNTSPTPRKSVTPRTGQLAAPRRIPTPRGVSPARSNEDDNWSEGFY